MEGKRHSVLLRVTGVVFAVLFCVFSVGCFDLGSYGDVGSGSDGSDYTEYYESLGDVNAIYKGGTDDYDVENSLFNRWTVNEFKWESSSYEVESREYAYLVINFEKDLNIDSIALYVKAEKARDFNLCFFLRTADSEDIENICFLGMPTEVVSYDDDGNEVIEEVLYGDPPIEEAFATYKLRTVENEWESFLIDEFSVEGKTALSLNVKDGDKIYIRVQNNTGYALLNESSPFTFMNLMIRALN